MKILIPTDFSECSEHSINASILIARKLGAELHLLHCIELPKIWSLTPRHRVLIDDLEELLRVQAKEKLEAYKELLIDHNIPCEYTISMNDYVEELRKEETMDNTDLVIIGAHGNNVKNTAWVGSHTRKVLRHIYKNTLIVNNDIADINFSKVVYVTGLALNEQNDFKSFLEFIKPFFCGGSTYSLYRYFFIFYATHYSHG